MVLTAEKAIRKHTEFKQMEAIRILPLRIEFRAKGCLPSRRETLNSISSIEEGVGGRWGSVAKNKPLRRESGGKEGNRGQGPRDTREP